jgi:hypothetical protein
LRRIASTIFPVPLGSAPTFAHELARFRMRAWKQLCESAGFDVVETRNVPLFYSGFFFIARLPLRVRRALAAIAGASTAALLTRPAAAPPAL